MAGKTYGYVRISSRDQNEDWRALVSAGWARIKMVRAFLMRKRRKFTKHPIIIYEKK